MSKKTFTFLILFLLSYTISVLADDENLNYNESIGGLRIGDSEKAIKKKIDCVFKKYNDTLDQEPGTVSESEPSVYLQTWQCDKLGLSIYMMSKKKGGTKTIAVIELGLGSKLKTKRGIQIGDSEQAVIKAYGKEQADDNKQRPVGESFVAGTIGSGLIFYFSNGKVSSIHLGGHLPI